MSYFQKLFSDRLFVVELAAANAVVYRLSVFIAVEWLRKLATENPLVVRHLFEDPCADFTIKRIVFYDDFVHFEAYGQCSTRIRKMIPAIFLHKAKKKLFNV